MDRILMLSCALGIALAAAPAAAKPPIWDTKIEGAKRFQLLKKFASEAVLDRETGLVWQRQPSTDLHTWVNGVATCLLAGTGGRKGWRLPLIEELDSLTLPSDLLPEGHPFLVEGFVFWSATTAADTSANAYQLSIDFELSQSPKSATHAVWCVRGGAGAHFD